jgi:hypothetical protein
MATRTKKKTIGQFYQENKVMVLGVGALAVGAVVWLIVRATSKGGIFAIGKQNTTTNATSSINNATPQINVYTTSPGTTNNSGGGSSSGFFPLRSGSKNAKVEELQNALIAIYDKATVLPVYGADGGFGSEMTTALTKVVGMSNAVVSETDFNKIIEASKAMYGMRGATLRQTFPNAK